jgi:NitT/TauT family transport system permease protein
MKTIKKIFTPFFDITNNIYLLIILSWIIIFGVIWSNAPVILPTPIDVYKRLIEFLTSSSFYLDVFSSLVLTIFSMLISIVLASILSYLYPIPFFKPIVNFIIKIRFMSLLGFIFVFMVLLHNAFSVKTSLLVFGTVPFFTLTIVGTITRIAQKEYDLWTTLKYSKWEQLYEIIIVGKADYVIEAIGINFAMTWLMMTVAESKSMADGGLGVLLFNCDKHNDLDKLFAIQIIIFILGISFDYLIKFVRHNLFPYTKLAEK